jgi:hypothetical protein
MHSFDCIETGIRGTGIKEIFIRSLSVGCATFYRLQQVQTFITYCAQHMISSELPTRVLVQSLRSAFFG